MSDLLFAEYNPLYLAYKTALRCGKCGLCRYIDNTKIQDINFSFICPPGYRFKFEEYWASGKSEILRGLVSQSGAVKNELEFNDRLLHALYTCTLCAGCQKICEPIGKEPLKTIFALREKAVLEEVAPLPAHQSMIVSIFENENPWMQPKEKKQEFVKNLATEDIIIKNIQEEKAPVLYYPGCFPIFAHLQPVAEAAVKILLTADTDFGILGENDFCCGSAILRIGDKVNFEKKARENIEILNNLGIETLVTSCASCLYILSEEYNEIADLNFEVKHINEILLGVVSSGKLPVSTNDWEVSAKKVTYHDSCVLGRYMGIYDEPRSIIYSIPNLQFKEMYRHRENSWCCGAGGGGEVKAAYPEFALFTARERIKEAKAVEAEIIFTSCPFCQQILTEASVGSNIEVYDLGQFVVKTIEESLKEKER